MTDEQENLSNPVDKNEQLPVVQPTPPPPEAIPTQSEPEVKKSGKGKLDLLPDHIKKEFHELIRRGYGEQSIKNAIEDRFLGKTDFLPASLVTYRIYINAHKQEIMQTAELQKSLLESTKESLTDVKTVLDSTLDSELSLENKKKALEALYHRCEQRSNLIASMQTNIPNAQLESVLGSYIREQRTILETLLTLQTELKKDTGEQLYKEMENITYDWCVKVISIYRQLHGENKLIEFKSALKEELPKVLKTYQK